MYQRIDASDSVQIAEVDTRDTIFGKRSVDLDFHTELFDRLALNHQTYWWLTRQYRPKVNIDHNLQLIPMSSNDPLRAILDFKIGETPDNDTDPEWLSTIITLHPPQFEKPITLVLHKQGDLPVVDAATGIFMHINAWQQHNQVRGSILQCHLREGSTFYCDNDYKFFSEILFLAFFTHIAYRLPYLKGDENTITINQCWWDLIKGNDVVKGDQTALKFLEAHNIRFQEKTVPKSLPKKEDDSSKKENVSNPSSKNWASQFVSGWMDAKHAENDAQTPKENEKKLPTPFYKNWKFVITSIGIFAFLLIADFIHKNNF
jgi:hypothetical protein